jgi:hypothetical protein
VSEATAEGKVEGAVDGTVDGTVVVDVGSGVDGEGWSVSKEAPNKTMRKAGSSLQTTRSTINDQRSTIDT